MLEIEVGLLTRDAAPLGSIVRSRERSRQIQSTGRATINPGAVGMGMGVTGEGEGESAPRKRRPLCLFSPCVLHVLCVPSSASSRAYTLARGESSGNLYWELEAVTAWETNRLSPATRPTSSLCNSEGKIILCGDVV